MFTIHLQTAINRIVLYIYRTLQVLIRTPEHCENQLLTRIILEKQAGLFCNNIIPLYSIYFIWVNLFLEHFAIC